jgi:type VI secretion system secreted protein Hcp
MMANKSVTRTFPRRAVWLTAAALTAAIGAVGLQGWSTVASEAGTAQVLPAAPGPEAPVAPEVLIAPDALNPGETQPEDEYFLKLDGIEGDSIVLGHEREMHIESFSWGATQAGSHGAGGGGGTGKVQFQDFHFTKRVDKASPMLFLRCATGEHIKEAKLTVRKAGGSHQEYLVVKLTDVLVTSYQTGGSADVVPTDQVSLNFTKIEYRVSPVKEDGSLGDPVSVAYDLKSGIGK